VLPACSRRCKGLCFRLTTFRRLTTERTTHQHTPRRLTSQTAGELFLRQSLIPTLPYHLFFLLDFRPPCDCRSDNLLFPAGTIDQSFEHSRRFEVMLVSFHLVDRPRHYRSHRNLLLCYRVL
jgi:hypothetical protein